MVVLRLAEFGHCCTAATWSNRQHSSKACCDLGVSPAAQSCSWACVTIHSEIRVEIHTPNSRLLILSQPNLRVRRSVTALYGCLSAPTSLIAATPSDLHMSHPYTNFHPLQFKVSSLCLTRPLLGWTSLDQLDSLHHLNPASIGL